MTVYTYATLLESLSLNHSEFIVLAFVLCALIAILLFFWKAGFLRRIKCIQKTFVPCLLLYKNCEGSHSNLRESFQKIKNELDYAFKVSKYFGILQLRGKIIKAAIGIIVSAIEYEKIEGFLIKYPMYYQRKINKSQTIAIEYQYYSEALALLQFEKSYKHLQNEVLKIAKNTHNITFVTMSKDRMANQFNIQLYAPLQNIAQFNSLLTHGQKAQ